jgi:hypothetical protein
MTRPNLEDPAERAAYRRELIGLNRGWRWLGLAIVVLSVAIMFVRGSQFDALSLSLLAVGWAILIGVIIKRTRYHRRRMREDV